MAKYTIEDSTLTAVADKLRERTGTADDITPEEMPGMVDEVFEAGEKSEYDRFWDVFQMNGTRRNYPATFAGSGWTDAVFNPKYEIVATSLASNMFMYSSQITSTKVPITIDTAAYTSSVFLGCTKLTAIPSITITAKVTAFSAWFESCGALEMFGLTSESVIAGKGFDVHGSTLLTHDSLLSILNALADYSADTSGTVWTVTLGETNLAKLSEEEIGIAEAKGWVLA